MPHEHHSRQPGSNRVKVAHHPTRAELVEAIAECVRFGLLAQGSTPERLIVPQSIAASRGR